MNTYILRYKFRNSTDVVIEHVDDSDFATTVELLCNLLHVNFLSISRISA